MTLQVQRVRCAVR